MNGFNDAKYFIMNNGWLGLGFGLAPRWQNTVEGRDRHSALLNLTGRLCWWFYSD